MYSPELEQLIQASLADGVLDDNEKIAIAKRAQAEGVDLAELEIYINSLIQKRVQNEAVQRRERAQAHEKERRGNVCPHCGTQIPPMTKLCPNCGQAVNSNETSGDKELFELIDKIGNAIIAVKSAQTREEFDAANAESEILLKKADLFYGENKKVQALKLDMEQELVKAKKKFRNKVLLKAAGSVAKSTGKVLTGSNKAPTVSTVISTPSVDGAPSVTTVVNNGGNSTGLIGRALAGAGAIMMIGGCFLIIPLFSTGYKSFMGKLCKKAFGV